MIKFARRFIVPLARAHGWKSFCEIGASRGLTADRILSLRNIAYTIIDPCLDQDLVAKYAGNQNVTVHKANSLDVLPRLDGKFDCILIDGDHNWYTVYHELGWIRRRDLLDRGGMIFLHDVGWPYGRRDMYYQPDGNCPWLQRAERHRGPQRRPAQRDARGRSEERRADGDRRFPSRPSGVRLQFLLRSGAVRDGDIAVSLGASLRGYCFCAPARESKGA